MVTFVLPGDVDDVTSPSGGNTYDRRMSQALGLHDITVPGSWPTPSYADRSALAQVLAGIPDDSVVLIDGLVACGVPEVVVPHTRRLRVAVLVHLPLADETGLAPAQAADLHGRERETLHAASVVIATSPWAAQRLVSAHGLPADRVLAVTPGTEPASLATGSGGTRLLCVAAVTPRKGQDVLVEALAGLAELEWSCECVGPLGRDAAFVTRLRELISQHGLTDRVTLTGPRTGDDLEAAYAAADLVVLPSYAETYGMVLTEALARGIPVLATNVDALPETVGHAPDGSVPGILVPPTEVTVGLALALRRFLTEPLLRARLKASALARRGTLPGWDTASERLAGVLARLQREPVWA